VHKMKLAGPLALLVLLWPVEAFVVVVGGGGCSSGGCGRGVVAMRRVGRRPADGGAGCLALSLDDRAATAVNRAAQALIEKAISTGVPRFNRGDAGGCALVYEECCRDVIALPGAVDADTEAATKSILERLPPSESEKAWALRRQLDMLFALLVAAGQAADSATDLQSRDGPKDGRTNTLVDFSLRPVVASWQGVNDVVMGGRSTGFISHEPDATRGAVGVFQGMVTAEGGGGFSSIRSAPLALDCSSSSGLSLLCKGDGRVYKLQVTCDRLAPGVKYQVEFETEKEGGWVEHRFDWSDFAATLRGQRVMGAPALGGSGLVITSLGLLTSKLSSSGASNTQFTSGPFRLELARLSTFA